MGAERATYFGEGDSLAAVGQDVFVADDMECTSAFYVLFGRVCRVGTNALAEAA